MNASSLFNDGIHLITSFLPHRDWLQASLTCHRWYNIAAHFEPHREILLSPLTLSDVNLLLSSSSPLSRHVTGLTSVHPEDDHLRYSNHRFVSPHVALYFTLSGFSEAARLAQKLPHLEVLDLLIKENPTACNFFSFDRISTGIGTPDPSPSSSYSPINTTTFYLPHLQVLTIHLPFTGSQSAFRFGLNCFLSQLEVSCPKLQYFTLEDESRWEGSTTNVAAIKEIMKTAMQHLQYIKQVKLYIPIEPMRTIIYAPANEINAITLLKETHHPLCLPNCILPWALLSVDSIERLHSVLPGQTYFTIGELLSDTQLNTLQRFRRLQTVSITGTDNSDPFTPSLIDALSHCLTITHLEFWSHSSSAEVWSQLFTSLPQLTSIHIRPVRNQLLRADSYASETRLKERFNEAWMLPRLEYFAIGRWGNHRFTWNQKRGTNTDKYRINTPPKAHLVGIEPNPGPN